MSEVSLVKSKNSYQGTWDALKLLENELKPLIFRAKKPVIKVNFVTAHNLLAATPVESVKATIDFIRLYSKNKILVAEEAVMGTTEEGWKNYGYHQLEKYPGVELYDLKRDKTAAIEIKDKHNRAINIPFSKTLYDSDFLISITRPKTHDAVVVTLTGKNVAVGGILGKSKDNVHQGNVIHQNILLILKKVRPRLAILEGTQGMEGQGPDAGTAVNSGWTAASLDWLAVDSLGVYLMGFDLENVGYLYLAKEQKLGSVFPEETRIVGENPELFRKKFKPHNDYSSQIQWRI